MLECGGISLVLSLPLTSGLHSAARALSCCAVSWACCLPELQGLQGSRGGRRKKRRRRWWWRSEVGHTWSNIVASNCCGQQYCQKLDLSIHEQLLPTTCNCATTYHTQGNFVVSSSCQQHSSFVYGPLKRSKKRRRKYKSSSRRRRRRSRRRSRRRRRRSRRRRRRMRDRRILLLSLPG